MEYLDRFRATIVNTYRFLQYFVDYALYGDLDFAYAGVGGLVSRDSFDGGLENVVFMGRSRNKAQKSETLVHKKSGEEVKVKGRRPRRSKRIKRQHHQKYPEGSHAEERLREMERESERQTERGF
jgi:hypothetical protein